MKKGKRVSLKLITTDTQTQMRVGLDQDVVEEYTRHLQKVNSDFPPIILFHDMNKYWVGDGFHRLAAARAAGLASIRAEVRTGTVRDAILYACGANGNHGLRRSNSDKRRAVETLLRDPEWSQWSDREIARRANVSHDFVSKIRSEKPQVMSSDDMTSTTQPRLYSSKTGKISQRDFSVSRATAKPVSDDDYDDQDEWTQEDEDASEREIERDTRSGFKRVYGPILVEHGLPADLLNLFDTLDFDRVVDFGFVADDVREGRSASGWTEIFRDFFGFSAPATQEIPRPAPVAETTPTVTAPPAIDDDEIEADETLRVSSYELFRFLGETSTTLSRLRTLWRSYRDSGMPRGPSNEVLGFLDQISTQVRICHDFLAEAPKEEPTCSASVF